MALLFGNCCSLGSQICLKHSAKWVNEVEWISKVKVIFWPWSKVTHISKLNVWLLACILRWAIQGLINLLLPELWLFVSFSHFINSSSCLRTSVYSFQGIWWNFSVIVPMNWRWSYFIEVMLNYFLPELWPFNNFSIVSLVSATPLAVLMDFNDTVQLLFPWREEGQI